MPYVTKTCSRCAQPSWASGFGKFDQTCKDGKPCDTQGTVYVDGEPVMGRLEF